MKMMMMMMMMVTMMFEVIIMIMNAHNYSINSRFVDEYGYDIL